MCLPEMSRPLVSHRPVTATGTSHPDPTYLHTRLEQYKKTFPNYELIGWYSSHLIASSPSPARPLPSSPSLPLPFHPGPSHPIPSHMIPSHFFPVSIVCASLHSLPSRQLAKPSPTRATYPSPPHLHPTPPHSVPPQYASSHPTRPIVPHSSQPLCTPYHPTPPRPTPPRPTPPTHPNAPLHATRSHDLPAA